MREIDYTTYRDKVLGGWIGKCLGTLVGRFEGTKSITRFNVNELLDKWMIANDDLDVQLVWLDVLLDKGIHLTSEHLMEAWVAQYDYNFGEYGFARRNWRRGLRPPASAVYGNRFYLTGMGCPIRSEIWAMIAPGQPELAAEYAYQDGILDHEGESVWAEQMLSAMQAEAFFEPDLNRLLELGLGCVPEQSQVVRCVRAAMADFKRGRPWHATWQMLRDEYSHPDCTYSPVNLGIIAMALLHGAGGPRATLAIAVNSGWDVDCTCASTGALLGIIHGAAGLEPRLVQVVGDQIVTWARTRTPIETLSTLTDLTCRVGVTLAREGRLAGVNLKSVSADIISVPTTSHMPEIELAVDYEGQPAIGLDRPKPLSFRVTNHSARRIDGRLQLDLPEGWRADWADGAEGELSLAPGEQIHITTVLQVSDTVPLLHDTNRLRLMLLNDAGNVWTHDFGLCGAPPARVLGPFFDAYSDWLKRDELPPNRLLETRQETIIVPELGEEWGNHRVSLDKAWIDEDFADPAAVRARFASGKRVNIFDDAWIVREAFGLQGPCCVYYYQELVSPDARRVQFFIGSTDPAQVWLNGAPVFTQRQNRFWFCNNDVIEVALNEGVNMLVLKLLRTGEDNRFSLVLRHPPTLWGYDSAPFVIDLACGTLAGASVPD